MCVCLYVFTLVGYSNNTHSHPTHNDVHELTFKLFFICIIIVIIVSIYIVLLFSSSFCAQISVRYSF